MSSANTFTSLQPNMKDSFPTDTERTKRFRRIHKFFKRKPRTPKPPKTP